MPGTKSEAVCVDGSVVNQTHYCGSPLYDISPVQEDVGNRGDDDASLTKEGCDYAKIDKSFDLKGISSLHEAGSARNIEENDLLENSGGEKLATIIEGCNDALKELKEARQKLESQLQDSRQSYAVLTNSESEEEKPDDTTEERLDKSDMGFDGEAYDEIESFQYANDTFSIDEFEKKMLEDGSALKALTSNLESFQLELDEMLKNLMEDEEEAFGAVETFFETTTSALGSPPPAAETEKDSHGTRRELED